MAFKTKTKTRLLIDDRQTLDAKHNNILTSFTNNKETLTDLYVELHSINTKLNELKLENSKTPMFNIEIQKLIWLYDDKKNEIEININRIENNVDENDYMLNTGKLISNYYKIINEEKNITVNYNNLETSIHPIANTTTESIIEKEGDRNYFNFELLLGLDFNFSRRLTATVETGYASRLQEQGFSTVVPKVYQRIGDGEYNLVNTQEVQNFYKRDNYYKFRILLTYHF